MTTNLKAKIEIEKVIEHLVGVHNHARIYGNISIINHLDKQETADYLASILSLFLDSMHQLNDENNKLSAGLHAWKEIESRLKIMTDLTPLPPAWVTNPTKSMTPMSKQPRS
jgi:hypothetical protein